MQYNPVCVAAWAYIVAAVLMGATAVLTVKRAEWSVPPQMYGPLLYWVRCSTLPERGGLSTQTYTLVSRV